MAGFEPSKTQLVYLALRDRIANGRLDSQGALPGEQALAVQHGVSRVTVRRALAELEKEGLITRRQGAGTFVVEGGAKPIVADLSNVLANIVAMGRETAVRLLEFAYRDPPAAIAQALKLASGEKTQFSVRVRLIDSQPFAHLTTDVPERIGVTYTEADLATRPLLALLERSGVQIERATQEITAVLASPEIAAALDVDVGSALIGMKRTVFASDGSGVEHLSALYRPDRYALHMDMVRTGDVPERRWSTVLSPGSRRNSRRSAGRPRS
ncbi:MAG TPA: GntR family transcriptional regulator [Aliidongia sp.]|uniref:GntR family transcriptional regulator n=1 Tax=Aliidongia sp. TaxID=1914230 RepID=UPI002DDDAA6E|nr:GntR family transcriptional regulator [Aliidongia sp.]HEV2676420.1 GntR family transcriptional regulator [Aliidongia sp.]